MTTRLIREPFRVDPDGRGYLAPSIFEGLEIIAAPCEERESRVFGRDANGAGGTDYRSHAFKLATARGAPVYKSGRRLSILVSHGGGHERLDLPSFYDRGAFERMLCALPEPLQYAALHTLWSAARDAAENAASATRTEWAEAFAENRIRKSRPRRGLRTISIEPRAEAAAVQAEAPPVGASASA